MESCSCVHCTADDFHREQMEKEFTDKDSYMETKSPSVYEKLEDLKGKLNSTLQYNLVEDIMTDVNSIHNDLLGIATRLDLKSTAVDEILVLQERLY